MKRTCKILFVLLVSSVITTAEVVVVLAISVKPDRVGHRTFAAGQSKDVAGVRKLRFKIDGEVVTLINGVEEKSIVPGSASKRITRCFGNELRADFNGDGKQDRAFIVTQTSGGSGTFFYLVVMLGKKGGFRGTEAVFIGDRIVPQTVNIAKECDALIEVNYTDRKEDEPFSATPSVAVTKRFKITDGTLVELLK